MAEDFSITEEIDTDLNEEKYLTFEIGNEDYGVKIDIVNEIIAVQKITKIPDVAPYIRGVINLRGMIVPVMDLRLKFKKEFKEYDERTCIIVVTVDDVIIGLIVDAVSDVLEIKEDQIVPPPKITKNYSNKYVNGIGKCENEVKLLLDCRKILTDEEAVNLKNSVK